MTAAQTMQVVLNLFNNMKTIMDGMRFLLTCPFLSVECLSTQMERRRQKEFEWPSVSFFLTKLSGCSRPWVAS